MGRKISKEQLMEEVFQEHYKKDRHGKLRIVRVRVPGREVTMAHIVGVSRKDIYHNLGLHIGVHKGEDHSGESLGILKFTPWECTVVAADIALKSGNVAIGFMDRFNGSLILTGSREEIRCALEGVLSFFGEELHFPVCHITES